MFAIAGLGFYAGVKTPTKIVQYGEKSIFIDDDIDCLEDEAALYETMNDFYKTTGIRTAILTVSNDSWKTDPGTLVDYAYDAYVNTFRHNEKCWLLVYSETVDEDGFVEWYWEGMQGDETDDILTESVTKVFNEKLQKNLLQREKMSVDEAFVSAFESIIPIAMKPHYDIRIITICLLVSGIMEFIIVYGFLTSLKPVKTMYYRKAIPCDLEIIDQEPCNYCGGIYIVGLHQTCPHCGAEVPVKEAADKQSTEVSQ